MSLSEDAIINIIQFLDFRNTINLNKVLNYTIKDIYIYWKSIEFDKILLSDRFLLKDKFKYLYNNKLKAFYDFIKNNKHICIAGGYPSLMFLGKDLKDYPDSDIDIYVMENYTTNETLKLIQFLDNNYAIKMTTHKNSTSVFNVKIDVCSRVLQVIITNMKNIQTILGSFDMGYIKCALYMGHTYVTYDAIYSKNINMTHTKFPHKARINKAYDKKMTVYNYSKVDGYSTKTNTIYVEKAIEINDIKRLTPINDFVIGYHKFRDFSFCNR